MLVWGGHTLHNHLHARTNIFSLCKSCTVSITDNRKKKKNDDDDDDAEDYDDEDNHDNDDDDDITVQKKLQGKLSYGFRYITMKCIADSGLILSDVNQISL